jgi:hypothetical protein
MSEEDRRRHRRVVCGGESEISLLPSDGALYLARLRNLSQGGMSLEMPCPLEVGARAELMVRISGLTFRTLAQVRTLERSRTGMEFVHLSAGGRKMLEEFLADLEEMQKAMVKVRSGRVENERDLWRELKSAGIRPSILNSRLPPASGLTEKNPDSAGSEKMIEPVEAIVGADVRVDVFG